MRIFFLFISICALFCACSSDQKSQKNHINQLDPEVSESLKTILKKVPITNINLDEYPTDSITIKQDNLMGFPASSQMPIIGTPSGMIKSKDSIYVADKAHQAILVMDENGTLYRKIGGVGGGPGEYKAIRAIIRNSRNIYVSDADRAELQIFTSDFNYITSIPGRFNSIRPDIAVNDEMLLIKASAEDSMHLIQVREANPPWQKKTSFFPKLIPVGYQPQAYNYYLLSMNKNGQIITCYPGLPYIFVYNNQLEHIATIAISAKSYDELNNPAVVPQKNIDQVSVSWFFLSLDIQDNGDIYFSNRHTLYVLKDSKSGYELTNTLVISYDNNPISIRQALVEERFLYLVSSFEEYIYKIRLSSY